VEWSNERCEEIEWTTTTRPSKAMGREQRNNFNMEDAYDLGKTSLCMLQSAAIVHIRIKMWHTLRCEMRP
jgi:hypothetical protein